MFNVEDICGKHDFNLLDQSIRDNIKELVLRLNRLNSIVPGGLGILTSGYRSIEDHERIYKEKGADLATIPRNSKHLFGMAADTLDKDDKIKEYLKSNPSALIDCQLWAENGTSGWLHVQTVPPRSGSRWFYP